MPTPPGYSTVTPWIPSYDSAALLDFLARAFGARELGRVPNGAGGIGHAETRIGDSVVMLFDVPRDWPPPRTFLRLYLEDAEATFGQAVVAGAEPVTEVTLLAFGDKVGRVRDPQGNIWWLQQRVEEVSAAEQQQRSNDPLWSKAMHYVEQSFVEAARP